MLPLSDPATSSSAVLFLCFSFTLQGYVLYVSMYYMTETPNQESLRTSIVSSMTSIPKALIPSSLKALDRLIGAAVDIPAAWLAQRKAQIDSQTQSYTLVEEAIARTAATEAGADYTTVHNAVNVLVRKSYRRQVNREAVAGAMVEELRNSTAQEQTEVTQAPTPDLDEDWLNIFERYAEDASTERMQNLWGRVLAGEIRKPGRYSARTLRFLSEFTQADGLMFAEFCKFVFGESAPRALIRPGGEMEDIRKLIFLESSGLIQGARGLGLTHQITFNEKGNGLLREGSLGVLLRGKPGDCFAFEACILTPLGKELLSLLPGRDAATAARTVVNAIRVPAIRSAFLTTIVGTNGELKLTETFWDDNAPTVSPGFD